MLRRIATSQTLNYQGLRLAFATTWLPRSHRTLSLGYPCLHLRPCLQLRPRFPLRLITPFTHPYTTSAKVNLAIRQMTQAPRHAMYDGGGGRRDLTLERPDEEIITKAQRPRSPPFRLPALPPARPSARSPSKPEKTRANPILLILVSEGSLRRVPEDCA